MKCPYHEFCHVETEFNTTNDLGLHFNRRHNLSVPMAYAAMLFKIHEKIAEWEVVTGDQDYEWKSDVLKELLEE